MKATELEGIRSGRTGNMEAADIIIFSSGYCLGVNCLHVQTVHFLISNIPKDLYVLFISLKIML